MSMGFECGEKETEDRSSAVTCGVMKLMLVAGNLSNDGGRGGLRLPMDGVADWFVHQQRLRSRSSFVRSFVRSIR